MCPVQYFLPRRLTRCRRNTEIPNPLAIRHHSVMITQSIIKATKLDMPRALEVLKVLGVTGVDAFNDGHPSLDQMVQLVTRLEDRSIRAWAPE